VSPKTRAALPYLIAGSVALLFVVIIGSFITRNIRVLVTSDLGNGAYYILLVVVSLASAILLFAGLKGSATLRGQFYGYAIELGGPSVLFFIVLLLGVTDFKSRQQDFDLVIMLSPGDGQTMSAAFPAAEVLNSTVNATVGPVIHPEHPDRNGRVLIQQLPFRYRYSHVAIALDSKVFIFKEPTTSFALPETSEPILTIKVAPRPQKFTQDVVKAKDLSRITSGGTSDGHSPFCQRRTTQGCVQPQHGGNLVLGSGGLTNQASNHNTRTGYSVVKNTNKEICVELFAATGACETELYIQGYVTALEDYPIPN
jgi:hypothetical protein